MSTTREHVILDLTSQDEAGEWVEGAEGSLAAIVCVRSELAAGDLRPLTWPGCCAHGRLAVEWILPILRTGC